MSDAEIDIGSVVGDYRIVSVLGRGGTATVYLGVDETGQERALKVYRGRNALKDPARFWREVQTVQNLHHPGLVEVAGFGWTPWPHLIMERVHGSTLKAWLRTNPPDRDRRKVADDIMAGVDYAHEHGVVHRDIKPENVFVRTDGRASVADFGTALSIDSPRLTTTGQMQGTPGYISPEQLKGERATAASDQYSIGVLMFELLVGKGPFAGGSALSSIYLQLSSKVPRVRAIRPEVTEAVDDCIATMMQTLPADRYASVAVARATLLEAWP